MSITQKTATYGCMHCGNLYEGPVKACVCGHVEVVPTSTCVVPRPEVAEVHGLTNGTWKIFYVVAGGTVALEREKNGKTYGQDIVMSRTRGRNHYACQLRQGFKKI